jgi:transglutaminase-like putative cysteine protease
VSRPARSLLPFAEAALVGVSLAVVAGFGRLFDDGSFFPRLAAFALVAHLTSIATRRAGWSVAVSGAVSLAVLAVTVGIVLYPDTTMLGIPTGDTLSAARSDFADVWNQFQSVQAPAPVTTSFLLAAGLSLWWSAFVADWAAFRVWVPFESVVPAGTVFVFASLFAAKKSQVSLAGLFVFAVIVFLLLHRVTRQQSNAGWVTADVQRGTNSLLRGGAALAIVAALVAMGIGPNLPQAHSAALLTWRGSGSSPHARTTVSPLVDINHRLVDQNATELFTVQSDHRSYWRLTALDQFDGQIWKSDGSYATAAGRLPIDFDTSAHKELARQSYTIEALDTIWLPAAYEPRAIARTSVDVRYESRSSTLIVGNDEPNSNRTTYNVQSDLRIFSPDELRSANGEDPKQILDDELTLPGDFSGAVRDLAQQIVAGQLTRYDKALALQNYFRNNFTYDLNTPPGHGETAIERFLDVRAGYCEQFAGTYAAMARAVGLPARVAVGFTPGDPDPSVPGLYHVRGLHAHAWPEVFFPGQGWVLFEPTPTRGAPNAQQYTGVAEEQGSEGGTATTLPQQATVPTTEPSQPSDTAPISIPNTPTLNTTGPENARPEPSFWSTRRFGGKALVTAAVIPIVLAVYAAGVLAFHAVYRRRRRSRATTPDDRVGLAWQEAIETIGLLGAAPRLSETPMEFAVRAASTVQVDGLTGLAAAVVRSDYAPTGAAEDDAARAVDLAATIEHDVKAKAPWQLRLRHALDPRPVDRRRAVRRRGFAQRNRADAPKIEILHLT